MNSPRSAWLFLAPALVVLGVFFLLPVLGALILSLTDYDLYALADIRNLRFVGLGNYWELLHRPLFWSALGHTVYFVAVGVPLSMGASLGAAVLLNSPLARCKPLFRTALFAPVIAFGILGVIGIWYPQLFGNGLDMARDAFLGIGSFSLLLTLFALKPLVTALCLGSGASGGLFTPTLSTGAVLGGALGIAWNLAWPGSPSGAFAMVCAAAMIGAAMQAPLSGLALVLELTHSGFGLMVPMMAATGIATLVAFHVDGYSIYSARLPAFADDSAPTPPAARNDMGSSGH